MANDYRYPTDFQFGTLTNAAAVSDTSLSSAEFATLPLDLLSSTVYVPLILLNPATRAHEKVWMTAHASGTPTVGTVARGKEGTLAQAWPAGTQWIVAPTVRDAVYPGSSGSLPSDGHVGMRVLQLDTGLVVEKTLNQSWLSAVGSRPAGIVGQSGALPSSRRPILKAMYGSATTNGSAQATFTLPDGAFPTACVLSWAQVTTGSLGGIITGVLQAMTVSSVTYSFWAGTTPVNNTTVVAHVFAIGY